MILPMIAPIAAFSAAIGTMIDPAICRPITYAVEAIGPPMIAARIRILPGFVLIDLVKSPSLPMIAA